MTSANALVIESGRLLKQRPSSRSARLSSISTALLERGTPRAEPFLVMGSSATRLSRFTLARSRPVISLRRIAVSTAKATIFGSSAEREWRQIISSSSKCSHTSFPSLRVHTSALRMRRSRASSTLGWRISSTGLLSDSMRHSLRAMVKT
ncbi:hypothetical protein FQZ97_958150 [compost metagenome]